MKHLAWFLCLRYLSGKKIVFLSVAAVAMSCALLITVGSLFTGFIHAFENGAAQHMGDIIIPAPSGLRLPQYNGLIAELEKHPDIVSATPVLSCQGLLLLGQGNVKAVQVWGIDLPGRNKVSPFCQGLLRQTNDPDSDFRMEDVDRADGGMVGIGVLASPDEKTDEYDIEGIKEHYIGRRVMLTTGTVEKTETQSGETSVQTKYSRRSIRFNITDIVFSGMYQFDREYIYLPIETLSDRLYPDQPPVADLVQVKISDTADLNRAVETVEKVFNTWAVDVISWKSLVNIKTAKSMQAPLIREYYKQKTMLLFIFGIVSAGVILLIFCIFYLIVMTKQKDIAIIKSCGLDSTAVTKLFVAFGLLIGVSGSAAGVGLGIVFTRNINVIERWISMALGLKLWKSSTYMFSRIPTEIDMHTVIWVTSFAIIAAGLGALIPALAAAWVRPVRILRYE